MSSTAEYQRLLSTLYQAFVEFPYSAFTTPRQLASETVAMAATATAADSAPSRFTIGPALFDLLQSPETVSSRLAENPKITPGEAWKQLFGNHKPRKPGDQDPADIGKGSLAGEELSRARQCGRWGPTEPSDLFVRVRLLPRPTPKRGLMLIPDPPALP